MTVLTVDDLSFEVRRSPRRRSIQITVDRGGELLLSAPEDCPSAVMERFIREKRFWIYTKLAAKEALGPAPGRKQLVNGEGHLYLGRNHRLLIVGGEREVAGARGGGGARDGAGAGEGARQEVPLKLEHGRFKLRRGDVAEGHDHFVRWYTARAKVWLTGRVERFRGRVGVEPGGVTVQDLGYRWGSCGKGGRLFFHWRTILLPPRIIEYVVVHELVHLVEPHHTAGFWGRVERVLPDFEARKRWLGERGREAGR